ncbi:hypothetical protein KC336_g19642, partial [Hortaea werneckii]
NTRLQVESSDRAAMAAAEALLRQLLQNQTGILTRLDAVDEKLENLDKRIDDITASQDQLSTKVCETQEAQNDIAVKVAAMRTHFHDPAGPRLVDTPELLEMILLQLDECPDEESRADESDNESSDCDEYTGKLFDVCHGLYLKCVEDPEAGPHLALEARADSEAWCHIMFDIEDISNLPDTSGLRTKWSESVAMSDAEALSQQLLRMQLQTPARLDLTASRDQLSPEVRNIGEAQNDAATKAPTLRTHC